MQLGCLGWSLIAAAMTVGGGLLPMSARFSSPVLWRLRAFQAGLLATVALVHLLPEAWSHHPSSAVWGCVLAVAAMSGASRLQLTHRCAEHGSECGDAVSLALLVGLFIHAFTDGVGLSSAQHFDARANALVGLALSLHNIADGFMIMTLFSQAGFGRAACLTALALAGAATPLGAVAGGLGFAAPSAVVSGCILAFAGAALLYATAAQILPIIRGRRDSLSGACFVAGALLIAFFDAHF